MGVIVIAIPQLRGGRKQKRKKRRKRKKKRKKRLRTPKRVVRKIKTETKRTKIKRSERKRKLDREIEVVARRGEKEEVPLLHLVGARKNDEVSRDGLVAQSVGEIAGVAAAR